MELFLDAVLQEFLEATDLLKRRAAGDYSPDHHLQTLVRAMKAEGVGATEIAKAFKIGRAPVYRALGP
jgi:DNA invertase Pin-like site-specific DNA recombinase